VASCKTYLGRLVILSSMTLYLVFYGLIGLVVALLIAIVFLLIRDMRRGSGDA
jgi:hypothetical protein